MHMNGERTLLEENRDYWTRRASGYAEIVGEELSTAQKEKWKSCLSEKIEEHFSDCGRRLRVLDAGTGPGFFAVLLAELGCEVTGIDLTLEMLEKAKENAGARSAQISFEEMNAEALTFEENRFDLVVSRNLTWNLPHPETAYREWNRVLKPGGLLLNFDANWYRYLYDEDARTAYEMDRSRSAEQGIRDQNIGANFDVMEEIAGRIPLSRVLRPQWDLELLFSLGMHASADPEIYKRVWSDEEMVNFRSTPMFLITASKPPHHP